VQGWAGPVSSNYQQRCLDLQHKILAKARALGMNPVNPSFGGFVPDAFARHYPDEVVKQTDGGWGGNFAPVSYVDPTSASFAAISQTFVKFYCAEYGCNDDDVNYYAADLYNELSPPSNDLEYLSQVSNAVYDSLRATDPNAVWVTQGWMFYSDQSFWQSEQIKAFVTGPPPSSLVIIDLYAEELPIWKETDSFFGQGFIFSTIFK